MYSSDNNNLHDHKILANQILELIESLGDDKLTAFFKQMDYPEDEKILYLYQNLNITPKYDKNNKILPVSETDQLDAVNQNGYAIHYIIEKGIIPSETVQLAAVNQNGYAIDDIIDIGIIPSEDVQLAAVNNKGYVIEYIKNPSEDVQLAAVNKSGTAIYYIIRKGIIPSEKVKQLAREKGIKDV